MAATNIQMVQVQLSPAGLALADGIALHVSSAGRAFSFKPGAPVEVELRFDWFGILRDILTPEGENAFELASPSLPATSAHGNQEIS